MRIGVVSEGPADFAVIRSVVKAVLGLDAADVDSIRPELQTDETELGRPNPRAFSNWELVQGNTSLKLFVVDLCAAAESREPGISRLSV